MRVPAGNVRIVTRIPAPGPLERRAGRGFAGTN